MRCPSWKERSMAETGGTIGYIVGGNLRDGLRVRLTVPATELQEGSFVVCDSGQWRFFGLVTDLELGATDPRFADERLDRLHPALARLLYGQTLFTTMEVYSTLMLDRGPEDPGQRLRWQEAIDSGETEHPAPRPVKTVPAHHAPVRLADAGDVAEIFGREEPGSFVIGHTLEQGYPVRLDLARFVKRSSGIFGATGTGKSFLARIMLAGLIQAGEQDPRMASVLVFDMHNEYSYDDTDENERPVKGLKSLFGQRVQVAALGKGSQVRTKNPDFTLEIGMSDLRTGDILMLSEALSLTDKAADVLSALWREFGRGWFDKFMAMEPGRVIETDDGKTIAAPNSPEGWARSAGIHESSAAALHRSLLRRLADRGYLVRDPAMDAVEAIVDKLENGRHVVLSFGKYESDLDYLLVSNVLTRRIRERWVKKTEAYRSGGSEQAPRPLVIVVEEAHKLLNPTLSNQTAFGTIARELRKYLVTLLIIDQRPSGIDDEVMSQLGTRVTGWLGDDDDIRAVLSGLSGRDKLRGMLARLREKEEVLLLGWGVRMPIPVRSRRFDQTFWDEMRSGRGLPDPGNALDEAINDDLLPW
jgi:DNA helicase HerA-like ATPase